MNLYADKEPNAYYTNFVDYFTNTVVSIRYHRIPLFLESIWICNRGERVEDCNAYALKHKERTWCSIQTRQVSSQKINQKTGSRGTFPTKWGNCAIATYAADEGEKAARVPNKDLVEVAKSFASNKAPEAHDILMVLKTAIIASIPRKAPPEWAGRINYKSMSDILSG